MITIACVLFLAAFILDDEGQHYEPISFNLWGDWII